MMLGRVIGTVVPAQVYEGLEGVPMLLVQPLDPQQKSTGSALVCCDPCAGAGVPLKYITVVVSDDHAMLFQYPGMPASLSLQGSAQMRLR